MAKPRKPGSHQKNWRVVERAGDEVRFVGRGGAPAKVNDYAFRQYLRVSSDALARGASTLTVDFSQCERAYPGPMVGIICHLDWIRKLGLDARVRLPTASQAQRLFLRTNWAHHLSPTEHPESDTHFDHHVTCRRFRDATEQQAAVTAVVDVVMGSMLLDRGIIAGLEWSINEITDNVLNHSTSDTGGFVQATTFRERSFVEFVVGDSGQGIPTAMRTRFPDLRSDSIAIGEAMKAGVTSNPEVGQGNGLAGTLRIATMSGGKFMLTSGQACIDVHQSESRSYRRRPDQRFEGTLLDAEIHMSKDFSIEEALGFDGHPHVPIDQIELMYEADDGESLVLHMKNETSGFGSRQSGHHIRVKCENLLAAAPSKRLVIDWDGVALISSSFADELVGKLFVRLTPLVFSARVSHENLVPIVATLINRAIMQRSAQALASS